MSCEAIQWMFSEYYDDALLDKAVVAAHLEACPDCATAYAEFQQMLDDVRDLPEPALPEGFHADLMRGIQPVTNRYRLQSRIPRIQFNARFNTRTLYRVAASIAACFVLLSFMVVGLNEWFITPTPSHRAAEDDYVLYDRAWGINPADEADAAAGLDFQTFELPMPIADPLPPFTRMTTISSPMAEALYRQQMDIALRVEDVSQTLDWIDFLAGDTLSSNINHGAHNATANLSLRVAAHDFAYLQGDLRELGEVVTERSNVTNFANEVLDLTARLTVNHDEIDRLNTLMAESENLNTLMAVQNALARAEGTRDQVTGRLNQIYAQVAYPVITVQLRETFPVYEAPPATFGERIHSAFFGSLRGIVTVMEYTVIVTSALLVPGVLVGVLVVVAWLVRRKRRY